MIADNHGNHNGEGLTHLTLATAEYSLVLDSISTVARGRLFFTGKKNADPKLTVKVAELSGDTSSEITVGNNIELNVGAGSDTFYMTSNIHIQQGGILYTPIKLVVQRNAILDLCGAMVNTRELVVKDGGITKTAYPARTAEKLDQLTAGVLHLYSATVDYQGDLTKSTRCGSVPTKLTLALTNWYVRYDFTLNAASFVISTGTNTTIISPPATPLNHTCPLVDDLVIENGQKCYLDPGVHSYKSIYIGLNGKLLLEGDATGVLKTLIRTDSLRIRPGGLLSGVGTGFINKGPGAGLAVYHSGSYGGLGYGGSPDKLYGDLMYPRDYGSNAYSASTTRGQGGGQLELDVNGTFINDGQVDMSGRPGSSQMGGGSGGSILVQAITLGGSGIFQVRTFNPYAAGS